MLVHLFIAVGGHDSLVLAKSWKLGSRFKKEELVQWEKNVSHVVVGLFLLLERIPKVLMLNKTFLL